MDKYLKPEEIVNVKCSGDTQETTINIDNSKTARLYTCYNPWITKIRKLVEKDPNVFKVSIAHKDKEGNITGYFMEFPSKLVNIRMPSMRVMSEEQTKKFKERMQKLAVEGKLGRGRKK